MEAFPERTYILTLGEDILASIDEKEGVSSSPSPQERPAGPRKQKTQGTAPAGHPKRGVGARLPSTHSAGRGPPASQVIASRADLPDEALPGDNRPKGKDSPGVPTTLEGGPATPQGLFPAGGEKTA